MELTTPRRTVRIAPLRRERRAADPKATSLPESAPYFVSLSNGKLWPLLGSFVLPVLGAAAMIVGTLALHANEASGSPTGAPSGAQTWAMSLMCALLGLALIAVAAVGRRDRGVLIAAGSSMVLATTMVSASDGICAAILLVAPALYGWLLANHRLRGPGSSLFLLAAPLIARAGLVDFSGLWVGLLLLPGMVLATVLLLRDHQALFATSALGGGLLSALVSMDRERAPLLLVLMVVLVAVGAAVYQTRVAGHRQSSLRRFAGAGLTAGALLVAALLFTNFDNGRLAGVLWFVSVTPFLWLSAWRRDLRAASAGERGDAAWVVWPYLAAIASVWLWNAVETWYWESLASAAVALTLYHHGRLRKSRFTSRAGILLLGLPAAIVIRHTLDDASDPRLLALAIVVALTGIELMRGGVYRVAWPWWVGFVSRNMGKHVGKAATTVGRGLAKAPVLGGVAWLASAAWSWLRRLKTDERLALEDVSWVAGCLFGAWAISTHVAARWSLGDQSVLFDELVWVGGGLLLLLRLVRRGHLYQRITALAILLTPLAERLCTTFSTDSQSDWLLMAITGWALVGYAALHTGIASETTEEIDQDSAISVLSP